MKRVYSLRLRLSLIILLPLLGVAGATGLWQLNNARLTASDVFDRSLQSAALAVANDVALSDGDALSINTRNILANTSGGPVFYHVYAPDGVIVAGYATPPAGVPKLTEGDLNPVYFNGEYLGREVRGYRMRNRMQIDGFSGIFTTTVWQDISIRSAFLQALTLRSFYGIALIIASLSLIVWFGIRIGLRPLNDLQDAIDLRSDEDLKPIRRPVPTEVQGIVQTLNRLLGQVSEAMARQNEFISNAAHQLRNPIAGVLSLAEAVNSAKDEATMRARTTDLVKAAKDTSQLAHKLLAYDRAKSIGPISERDVFSVKTLLVELIEQFNKSNRTHVSVSYGDCAADLKIAGDKTMMREAVSNIIDNALVHGGADLTTVAVDCQVLQNEVLISVIDDGVGLSEAEIQKALQRFEQVSENNHGSGLGLPIVEQVVENHGGRLKLSNANPGLEVRLYLPAS